MAAVNSIFDAWENQNFQFVIVTTLIMSTKEFDEVSYGI